MSIQREHEPSGKKRITLTMEPEIHSKAVLLAKADNRNLSNYLETLVLEKSGKLTSPKQETSEGVAV